MIVMKLVNESMNEVQLVWYKESDWVPLFSWSLESYDLSEAGTLAVIQVTDCNSSHTIPDDQCRSGMVVDDAVIW